LRCLIRTTRQRSTSISRRFRGPQPAACSHSKWASQATSNRLRSRWVHRQASPDLAVPCSLRLTTSQCRSSSRCHTDSSQALGSLRCSRIKWHRASAMPSIAVSTNNHPYSSLLCNSLRVSVHRRIILLRCIIPMRKCSLCSRRARAIILLMHRSRCLMALSHRAISPCRSRTLHKAHLHSSVATNKHNSSSRGPLTRLRFVLRISNKRRLKSRIGDCSQNEC
jgi:hypothetical protein